MAKMYSYRRALDAALKVKDGLLRVLEWGPGRSTHQFLRSGRISKLLAIEHNQQWWYRLNSQLGDVADRVNLLLIEDLRIYVDIADGRYEIIFIDGRQRRRCIQKAKELVTTDGIVLLHDAEREQYNDDICSWPFAIWSPDGDVVAMGHEEEILMQWYQTLLEDESEDEEDEVDE